MPRRRRRTNRRKQASAGFGAISRMADSAMGVAVKYAPEAISFFEAGGGVNGAKEALSLKTGFNFTTKQFEPHRFLWGWGPGWGYKAGKKVNTLVNKVLR